MSSHLNPQIAAWYGTLNVRPARWLYLVSLQAGSRKELAHVHGAARVQAFADKALAEGADAYYGVLLRDRLAASAKGIAAYDANHADLDVGKAEGHRHRDDAIRALERLPVLPSSVVGSGGGLHVRYQLTRPIEPALWHAIQIALTGRLGADRAAMDAARLHRIPGTRNYKQNVSRPVELLAVHPAVEPELLMGALEIDARDVEVLRANNVDTVAHAAAYEPFIVVPREHSGRPFDIANDVPVHEVLAALGVVRFEKEGGRMYCRCPACKSEDDRSMVVGGRTNTARCFQYCGRGFTAVDLVVAVRGLSPRSSVDWLCEQFGRIGFQKSAEAR